MIGGVDTVITNAGVPLVTVLRATVQLLVSRWPEAVFEDPSTSELFSRFRNVPFHRFRELMVYRDLGAFRSWEELGADSSNMNQMIHLLASEQTVTVVVDDPHESGTAQILGEIKSLIEHGLAPMLEAA
jgi:hypothetical protein